MKHSFELPYTIITKQTTINLFQYNARIKDKQIVWPTPTPEKDHGGPGNWLLQIHLNIMT